jgi:hypothetical protein
MQCEGFPELVKAYLAEPSVGAAVGAARGIDDRFAKANKALAFEIANMLDEDTSLYTTGIDRGNGISLLLALSNAIVAASSTHTNALTERFTKPRPVSDPSCLHCDSRG